MAKTEAQMSRGLLCLTFDHATNLEIATPVSFSLRVNPNVAKTLRRGPTRWSQYDGWMSQLMRSKHNGLLGFAPVFPGRIANSSCICCNQQNNVKGRQHAAVELITKSLAIELGRHGITVNSICAGMIDTEIDAEFPLASGFQEYFSGHIPLGNRIGTVADCVGAAIFFASAAGRYVTGQHLVVDGGLLCEQAPRLQFMPPFRPGCAGQTSPGGEG